MFDLREYQQEADDATFKAICRPGIHPLVVEPTGTGKSIQIAAFVQRILKDWPHVRFLVLTHVKELIGQDYEKLKIQLPDVSMGIYSAGLKRKETDCQVTVAGIQSVYKKADILGKISFVLIDEAHLVPQKDMGMYRTLLKNIKIYSPGFRVIGYTATPYRMGTGLLTDGVNAIFNNICYSVGMRRLIDEGWLAPLTTKLGPEEARPDTSKVKKSNGDFQQKDLAIAVDKAKLIRDTVQDVIIKGHKRKKWLVFCVGIDHAEHTCKEFKDNGIWARTVTSKSEDRDETISLFKAGKLRCVVNVGVLTTGFDVPDLDLIVLMRPTLSTNLYVQMLGRLTRPFPGKINGLVLDYAENILRHGPVDQVVIRQKVDGVTEVTCMPQKECPKCKALQSIAARECPDCGFEFPPPDRIKHGSKASTLDILSRKPEWVKISRIDYSMYQKPGNVPVLKVTYSQGLQRYVEFISFEKNNYAREKGHKWWYKRSRLLAPTSVEEALQGAKSLDKPIEIKVKKKDEYWKILDYKFGDNK